MSGGGKLEPDSYAINVPLLQTLNDLVISSVSDVSASGARGGVMNRDEMLCHAESFSVGGHSHLMSQSLANARSGVVLR